MSSSLYNSQAFEAGKVLAASPSENKGMTTGLFFKFAAAGAICCSATHAAVVPIDVAKTKVQLEPTKYNKGMIDAFKTIVKEEGAMGLLTGLGPTAGGYAAQGAVKFGFYELFKKILPTFFTPETAYEYRTAIYLTASGSAEFIADLALCPNEAARIRMVADPNFAKSSGEAFAKIYAAEGVLGFYKGLAPLCLKQIPYTQAKFVVFEKATEAFYNNLKKSGKTKADLTKNQQLAVSLVGGVTAGLVAAVISHPADTVLSKINKTKTDGGVGRAIVTILKDLGFRKLWLGLGTRMFMVGTLTAGQFFIYDSVKLAFGLPVSAGIVDPKAAKAAAAAAAEQKQ